MPDFLRLQNLQFFGHHGVHPEEQVLGQEFQIDVELHLPNLKETASLDTLNHSVDYVDVIGVVEDIVTKERFKLIESLAEEIAQRIGQHWQPPSVMIRVRKPHPPIATKLDSVEVEIIRTFG